MVKSPRLAGPVLLALLTLHAAVALAAGPTGEETHWNELQRDRYPLAISADGRWVVHAGAEARLHRQSVEHGERAQVLQLPQRIVALDIAADGAVVAFADEHGCVGLVDFAEASVPALRWLPQHWDGNRRQLHAEAQPSACDAARRPADAQAWEGASILAIALSPDARQLAVAPWFAPLLLLDTASGALRGELPGGVRGRELDGDPIALRFVDAGRRLMVVSAVFGEQYEAAALPSDLRFAVWNLHGGELQQLLRTRPESTLVASDFLHAYADVSGTLHTVGNPSPASLDAEPLQWRSTAIHDCAGRWQVRHALSRRIRALASDAQGRLLGLLSDTGTDWPEADGSLVQVRDAHTGELLQQWPVDDLLADLVMSPDGRQLFATTRGRRAPGDVDAYEPQQPLQGGGSLQRFTLDRAQQATTPATAAEWPETTCPIEDETAQARQIAIATTPLRVAARVDLPPSPRVQRYQRFPKSLRDDGLSLSPPCEDASIVGVGDPNGPGAEWGVDSQGRLWIDHGDRLRQIDPESAEVLDERPAPRSPRRCAHPVFARDAWLAYEGDTVALRAFDKGGERQVLQRRPGWRAWRAALQGDRLLVEWAVAPEPAAPPTTAFDGRSPTLGSGKLSLYALADGALLREIDGYAEDGEFQGIDEWDWPADGFRREGEAAPALAPGDYAWQLDYFGSVRARRADADGVQRTVLWSGLCALGRCARLPAVWVRGLGEGLGAASHGDHVAIYDARRRRLLGAVALPPPQRVALMGGGRYVVIEHASASARNDGATRLTIVALDAGSDGDASLRAESAAGQ